MRKSVIALAAAALFGVVSVAAAADVTGTIKSIDPSAATVTLDNGQTFALSAALKSPGRELEGRRQGEGDL